MVDQANFSLFKCISTSTCHKKTPSIRLTSFRNAKNLRKRGFVIFYFYYNLKLINLCSQKAVVKYITNLFSCDFNLVKSTNKHLKAIVHISLNIYLAFLKRKQKF